MSALSDAAGDSTLVFVYGSLKRGEHNHALLAGAEYVGAGVTRCEFRLFALAHYPAMLRWPAAPLAIEGEVYRVDAATLAWLDRLEDNGRLYQREVIEVVLADGSVQPAWAYLYLQPLPAESLHRSACWNGS